MQDAEIKKEILAIINNHSSELTKSDLPLLHGLNFILNQCTDRNGCRHDDLGRFAGKDKKEDMKTTPEEKQKKIDSVRLDFYKDNYCLF